MKQLFAKLDELAAHLNPWLLIVALGLGALDGTIVVGLRGPEAVALLMQRDHVQAAEDRIVPGLASSAMSDWTTPPLGSR